MKKRYIWYLVVGIIALIVPTAVYLGFLIPKMKEEYIILMSSGGIIGAGGFFGANKIPDKIKFASVLKLAANSFTAFITFSLIQEFFKQIVGLLIVFVVSLIIFLILKEVYKNAKQKHRTTEIATEIARSIVETTK